MSGEAAQMTDPAEVWERHRPALHEAFLRSVAISPLKARADRLKRAAERNPQRAPDLYSQAADLYLRSGHVEEGLTLACLALWLVGLPLPNIRGISLARAGVRELRRRLFEWKNGIAVQRKWTRDPSLQTALDVLFTTAKIFAMVEPTRAWELETQHFEIAMEQGDVFHQARAYALRAAHVAALGQHVKGEVEHHIAQSEKLLGEVPRSRKTASIVILNDAARALIPYHATEWKEALEGCAQVARRARSVGASFSFEAITSELFAMATLFFMGEFSQLMVRHEKIYQEAEVRGDQYALATAKMGLPNLYWLIQDRPAVAAEMSQTATRNWERADQLSLQLDWQVVSDVHIALYEGRGHDALAICRRRQPPAIRLMRSVEAFMELLHARAAVAAALRAPLADRRHILQEAQKKIASAQRRKVAGLAGLILLLNAAIDVQNDRQSSAIHSCHTAALDFEKRGMKMFELAATIRLAELQGQPSAAARKAMNDDRVKNPSRMCDLLAPGFPT